MSGRLPLPFNPHSDIETEAERRKTELLFRNSGIAQAVNILNATLLIYILISHKAPARPVFAWWCLIVAAATGRYLLARRFWAAKPDAASAMIWRHRYLSGTALIAATWGFGTFPFMWHASDGVRLFTALVLSGMIAGAVPLLSSVPAAFRLFAALVGFPMSAVIFLRAHSALHVVFGLMCLIFLAAVLASAGYLHDTLDVSIRLGLEQGRLIVNLEQARVLAETALSEREKLAESQRLLMAAVEQSNASIVVTDRDTKIIFANSAFTQTTGYSLEEALGQNPRILKSGVTPPETYRELWAALTRGQAWHDELCNKKKNGELYWEAASISPIIEADGQVSHYLAVMDDITQRRAMEEELRHLATTDPLTGVANRRRLMEQIEMELARVKRSGEPASFLMVDIDHFKKINDTHGHAVGDAVLQHLAGLSRLHLRRVDLFGRLGGEEFGILLPRTDASGAIEFAEGFRRRVADKPLEGGKGVVAFTLSIGITQFKPDDDAPDSILARADAALYRAKEGGRNRVEVG